MYVTVQVRNQMLFHCVVRFISAFEALYRWTCVRG